MAVLLDTADVADGDRPEAFRAAMIGVTGSTRVDLERPPGGVSGRMDLWSLGTTRVFSARSTGVSMVRDSRAARGASPEAVAIAVHGEGVGRHETGTGQRLVRRGELMVVDITRPYSFSWTGFGSSASLQVPTSELGMDLDAVQRAAARIQTSPLYGIVSRHLVELTRMVAVLSSSPAAGALGTSSTLLVSALLAGADAEVPSSREVLEHTLAVQARAYVRHHLRDPSLDPESVAIALSVSRRQLFRVCARAGFSLEQYIISSRLEGSKDELGSPAGQTRSIAAVAHSWGFKDPTHFSRRFHAAYGLLPGEWRRLASESTG